LTDFHGTEGLVRDAKTGEYEKTMELFKRMQLKGMRLDRFSLGIVLNACASLQALKRGQASSRADHANWLQG
jgi:pentatricopeptide repeat protein